MNAKCKCIIILLVAMMFASTTMVRADEMLSDEMIQLDNSQITGGEIEAQALPGTVQTQKQCPIEPYPSRDEIEKHVMQDKGYGDGKAQEWEGKYQQPVTNVYKRNVTQVIKETLTKEELQSLERASIEGAIKDAKATRNKDGTFCVEMSKYPELGFFVLSLIENGNASVTSNGKVHLVESGENVADALAIETARQRQGYVARKEVRKVRKNLSGLNKKVEALVKSFNDFKPKIDGLEKRFHDLNLRVDDIEKTIGEMKNTIGLHSWWLALLTLAMLWPIVGRLWQNRNPSKSKTNKGAKKKEAKKTDKELDEEDQEILLDEKDQPDPPEKLDPKKDPNNVPDPPKKDPADPNKPHKI